MAMAQVHEAPVEGPHTNGAVRTAIQCVEERNHAKGIKLGLKGAGDGPPIQTRRSVFSNIKAKAKEGKFKQGPPTQSPPQKAKGLESCLPASKSAWVQWPNPAHLLSKVHPPIPPGGGCTQGLNLELWPMTASEEQVMDVLFGLVSENPSPSLLIREPSDHDHLVSLNINTLGLWAFEIGA